MKLNEPVLADHRESCSLAVARVAIAAAWADGVLSDEELECLQDLLYQMPTLSTEGLREMQRLLRSPISPAQREAFLADLKSHLSSRDACEFALYAIHELIAADGTVTSEEQALFDKIVVMANEADTSALSAVFTEPLARRLFSLRPRAGQSRDIERFVHQHVRVMATRLELSVSAWRMAPTEEEHLALMGAMIARLPLPGVLMPQIRDEVVRSLRRHLKMEVPRAVYVSIAATTPGAESLDLLRVARRFFEGSSEAERRALPRVAFDLAESLVRPGVEQLDAIMNIAANLRLPQKDFEPLLEAVGESWGERVMQEMLAVS
ncbi:MAG: TerB family tellurite resistance protein [Opitutales bacterium]|nr:TerB family tellurite resistance protein [Opitutales bacterium]